MSFWKTIGSLAQKAGKYALDEAKKNIDEMQQQKEDMIPKNDDELLRIVKKEAGGISKKSMAAWGELKSRGYSVETIKNHINKNTV